MEQMLLVAIVLWFALAIGCGLAAHARGYPALAGFLLSWFFTPLVALVVLLLLPRRDRMGQDRQRVSLDDRGIQAIAEAHKAGLPSS